MRTRTLALLVGPLLLLASACADQIVAPPQEVLLSTTQGEAAAFQIIELGGLMTGVHGSGRANAIHSNPTAGEAVVVGAAHWMGDQKAVVWRVAEDGTVSGPDSLGSLPPPFGDSHPYQVARDVNSAGVIVGEAMFREGHIIYAQRTVGFVFDGAMKTLPWLVGDSYAWFAWEVNDTGLAVGWIRYAAERDGDGNVTDIATRGALWLPPYEADPILLDPLEGHTSANARTINNDGTVAGWSWTGADSVGVYWEVDGAGSISGPYMLAPGFRSTALNASGQVAGHAFGEAALWDPNSGSLTRLGTLHQNGYSQAFGINDADGGAFRTVGWSGRTLDASDRLPTIWNTPGSGPVQLALPGGYTGGYASDIDERGWIVGVGYQKQRNLSIWQALLWRPQQGGGGNPPPPSGDGPTASFTYRCQNTDTCQLTDTSTPGGSAIDAWLWTSSAGHSATTQHTSFTFTAVGSYSVTLRVTDGSGHSDEASVAVNCSMHQKHGLRCS